MIAGAFSCSVVPIEGIFFGGDMDWTDGYLAAMRHMAMLDAAREPPWWEVTSAVGAAVAAGAAFFAALISWRSSIRANAISLESERSALMRDALIEHERAKESSSEISRLRFGAPYVMYPETKHPEFEDFKKDLNEGFLQFEKQAKEAFEIFTGVSAAKSAQQVAKFRRVLSLNSIRTKDLNQTKEASVSNGVMKGFLAPK